MVVLRLPSHLLMLPVRKKLPTIEADLDAPFTRSDDLFPGREEYRSRIEDCLFKIDGECFAHLISPSIAELALGALHSRGAVFGRFTVAACKETWDMVSTL